MTIKTVDYGLSNLCTKVYYQPVDSTHCFGQLRCTYLFEEVSMCLD